MLDAWLVLNGHKGVNQQGNKSLLSYRTGYGVPGYSGYIPACESIPYSVKDETRRLVPAASMQRDVRRPRSHASSRLPPLGRFVGTTYDYDFFRTAAELPKERIGRRNTNGGHWMGAGKTPPGWARAATAPSTTFRSTLSAEGFPAKPFTALRSPPQ